MNNNTIFPPCALVPAILVGCLGVKYLDAIEEKRGKIDSILSQAGTPGSSGNDTIHMDHNLNCLVAWVEPSQRDTQEPTCLYFPQEYTNLLQGFDPNGDISTHLGVYEEVGEIPNK